MYSNVDCRTTKSLVYGKQLGVTKPINKNRSNGSINC